MDKRVTIRKKTEQNTLIEKRKITDNSKLYNKNLDFFHKREREENYNDCYVVFVRACASVYMRLC